jgi:3-hydroxyisobutyrate dehydrogenase
VRNPIRDGGSISPSGILVLAGSCDSGSVNSPQPRIAFLGLGIMGTGMARRLLGAGFALTVYNRDPAKAQALAAEGAAIATSPRLAAQGAEFVLAMLADDVASRAIWFGADGVLAGARAGAVMIECSTLTVAWVKELAAAVAAAGGEFADAPVMGSKAPAATGELNFVVGAADTTLERIRPVLTPMGRSIRHLGPVGSGATMKLINNFVSGVQLAALAEAINWIEHSGLERTQAVSVLTEGAPGSPLVRLIAGRILAEDFRPNFLLRLMAKDLRYAVAEAGRGGVPLETAALAQGIFDRAVAAGQGEKDMAALIELLRER